MDAQAWVAFAGVIVLLFIQTAAVAFWGGKLSERGRSNSRRIDVLEKSERDDGVGSIALIKEVATLSSDVKHLGSQVQSLERLVEGANRQLASLVTRRKGVAAPMADTQTDY